MICCSRELKVITKFKNSKICLIFLRAFFLVAHLIVLFLNYYIRGAEKFVRNLLLYFTYWALAMTTLYYFLTLFTTSYQNPVTGTLAKMNQFLFGINYMVTILFFGAAFSLGDRDEPTYFLGIINHLLPFFSIMVEFTFNNHVFFYRNLFSVMVAMPIYVYWNIFQSMLEGKPVYDEIDMATVEGVVYSVFSMFLGMLGAAFGVWYQSAVKSWMFGYEELASH